MTESIVITDMEADAIGEISNICMGSAATTLSTLFGKKVAITTPRVSNSNWHDLCGEFGGKFVCVKVSYTQGIKGSNILLLDKKDACAIAGMMMMEETDQLGEIELSAVGEVANQMIGASSTSLATIVGELIDIEPPHVSYIDEDEASEIYKNDEFLSGDFIQIRFKLEIEDLVDSYLLQLLPVEFAKSLCESTEVAHEIADEEVYETTTGIGEGDEIMKEASSNNFNAVQSSNVSGVNTEINLSNSQAANVVQQAMQMQQMQQSQVPFDMGINNVNVQQAQFASFIGGNKNTVSQPENIDLIMDVPLEVTVELGRTNKSISEILEFKPGTIVELNKVTGTPIDVLVNGKLVARGEVVVIDENFGIRIVDIIK